MTEPYPGRWTVHIPIFDSKEIDKELLSWIQEAYLFAESKQLNFYPFLRRQIEYNRKFGTFILTFLLSLIS